MAITGSQAIEMNRSTNTPYRRFLLILQLRAAVVMHQKYNDYFNIGILIPCRFAASMAIS